MTVSLVKKSTSLGIEVKNGVDKAGDPIFTTKIFSNIKNAAEPADVYEVAKAIKGIMSENTRDALLSVTSTISNA